MGTAAVIGRVANRIAGAKFTLDGKEYKLAADDGVRLLVDDKPLINEWHDQAMMTHAVEVELSGGAHRVVLEYFEHFGSAAIKLNWSVAPCLAKVPIRPPCPWAADRAAFTPNQTTTKRGLEAIEGQREFRGKKLEPLQVKAGSINR